MLSLSVSGRGSVRMKHVFCRVSVHNHMCACMHKALPLRVRLYGCSAEGVALPHLIVVPLSTAPNWLREFQTWAPQLNVVALSGNRVRRL